MLLEELQNLYISMVSLFHPKSIYFVSTVTLEQRLQQHLKTQKNIYAPRFGVHTFFLVPLIFSNVDFREIEIALIHLFDQN